MMNFKLKTLLISACVLSVAACYADSLTANIWTSSKIKPYLDISTGFGTIGGKNTYLSTQNTSFQQIAFGADFYSVKNFKLAADVLYLTGINNVGVKKTGISAPGEFVNAGGAVGVEGGITTPSYEHFNLNMKLGVIVQRLSPGSSATANPKTTFQPIAQININRFIADNTSLGFGYLISFPSHHISVDSQDNIKGSLRISAGMITLNHYF